jgi:predicted amidophosphoribosyltransferase
MDGTSARRCESCRQPLAAERHEAYCGACAAAFDDHFRRVSNMLIREFAHLCRATGDEAQARRIEKGMR